MKALINRKIATALVLGLGLGLAAASHQTMAQATAPCKPGTAGCIDLKQPIVDDKGKPVKDVSDRRLGVRIEVEFQMGDHTFHKGEEVTGAVDLQRLASWVDDQKKAWYVVPLDPTCKDCSDLTVGKVLAEALVTKICAQQNPGQHGAPPQKPAECTANEEQDENDILRYEGRKEKAKELRSADTAPMMGDKSTATLKNLILVRFKDYPDVAMQAIQAISPNSQTKPFGTD